MNIGFDLRPAYKPNSRHRGIGRYTRELAESCCRLNQEHELLFFTLGGRLPEFECRHEVAPLLFLRKPSRLNWLVELALFPGKIRRHKLGLFHATDILAIPKTDSCPVLATVHDLIPFVFWEETVRELPKDLVYALTVARRRIQEADHILTVSMHAKEDICQRLGVSDRRVSVVYEASSTTVTPVERNEAERRLARDFGLSSRFLLYVGGSDYRKNLSFLIEGFAELRRKGYKGSLVLLGETFRTQIPEVKAVKRLVTMLGLNSRVLFPGFVSDSDLGAFYSACDFFVFPSLYEGFGLPLLEAMRCGAPILSSSAASLPEVAGDSAGYFDPTSMESFTDVFWSSYESAELLLDRVARGRERVATFSWEKAGMRLLDLYDRLSDGSVESRGPVMPLRWTG
ncbi:MAG: glycosyltransferase family 4 protein [Acidobacteriota bacterium]|nr:MAG: glycosyltransferase family 4 protein [Acidobacteriota bacterium]